MLIIRKLNLISVQSWTYLSALIVYHSPLAQNFFLKLNCVQCVRLKSSVNGLLENSKQCCQNASKGFNVSCQNLLFLLQCTYFVFKKTFK